jgi:CubicO group peptidase (beta-lactamase class C family)
MRALAITLFLLSSSMASSQGIVVPQSDYVLRLMRQHHVPTVGIGIIESEQITHVEVYGELNDHSPAPENTIFNIASVTKPVVSALTLILVSQGQWQLDEPLVRYWTDPDVASDPRHRKITSRHVLSHQSGLPNWRGHEPGGKLSFAFEPGTDWKYSGEGFEYLRQALEHKFKKPIETLTDSLVFKPLGMFDTRFFWDETMDPGRYANRHRSDGSPYEIETWTTANASNLLLTTVGDYCKFSVGVLKRTGLTNDVAAEMVTPQSRSENGKRFGLGWSLVKGLKNGEHAIMHTGRNAGINTIVILWPVSGSGVVIFTNGEEGDRVYKAIISQMSDIGDEVIDQMN